MKAKCPQKLRDLASILSTLDELKLERHEYEVKYGKNDQNVAVSRQFTLMAIKACSFSPARTPSGVP